MIAARHKIMIIIKDYVKALLSITTAAHHKIMIIKYNYLHKEETIHWLFGFRFQQDFLTNTISYFLLLL